ncbi:MAG: helix-hairpin-helix domain-containing protein [Deltaproteobacteria bacterium]|nr:helix-hairpin-helix domain-containing protein [Deltaproteobacteria bacterium]
MVWKMISPANDRINGLLILLLTVFILYSLKSALNSPRPQGSSCDEDLFIQIEGDIRHPGVYPFRRQAGLMELIERAGGLSINTRLPERFKNVVFDSDLKVMVQRDGDGWKLFQTEISAFHKITIGIPISLNSESEEGLTAIPGIGPGLAKAIVKERSKRGGFKELNEILSVRGIGKKTYQKIAPYVAL